MSMSCLAEKRIKKKLGLFRFKRLKDKYLLTNEAGDFIFLDSLEFEGLVFKTFQEDVLINSPKYNELLDKGFIETEEKLDSIIQRYSKRYNFFNSGTVLHIIVITLRCNNKCLYCQTMAGSYNEENLDMTKEIAADVVDRIWEASNNSITIEFQGGEPLLNFETLKFIVEYAEQKNGILKKKLNFSLVSNLSSLTEEKMDFLMKHNVSICTSLDGPKHLHNKNRVAIGKDCDSYRDTVDGIKKIWSCFKKNNLTFKPNALVTVTKESLKYPKEIVDEYIALGFERVFLRPLNTFVLSSGNKKTLYYSPSEFLSFYKKAFHYILSLNSKGKLFQEATAYVFLVKILKGIDPNFMDMRSPCGAAIGQLAYQYNGDVYTCDEGRMLSRRGDDTFRLGNVKNNTYEEFINSPVVKMMCISSCLDNLPGCSDCVYKPYCGVCPLMNYAQKGDPFIQRCSDEKCLIQKGIFDYLFELMEDKDSLKIFEKWMVSQ